MQNNGRQHFENAFPGWITQYIPSPPLHFLSPFVQFSCFDSYNLRSITIHGFLSYVLVERCCELVNKLCTC